jgi:hypothetical protein
VVQTVDSRFGARATTCDIGAVDDEGVAGVVEIEAVLVGAFGDPAEVDDDSAVAVVHGGFA